MDVRIPETSLPPCLQMSANLLPPLSADVFYEQPLRLGLGLGLGKGLRLGLFWRLRKNSV